MALPAAPGGNSMERLSTQPASKDTPVFLCPWVTSNWMAAPHLRVGERIAVVVVIVGGDDEDDDDADD